MARFLIDNRYFECPEKFGDIYLVQIGRRFCERDGGFGEHLHKNWYEMTIVTDGEADVITNGHSTHIKKGDIHLSFPCDVHEIICSSDKPLSYDFFSFYTADNKYASELSKLIGLCPRRALVLHGSRIPQLVSEAIVELNGDGVYRVELLTSLFSQILICLFREALYKKGTRPLGNIGNGEMLSYQIMSYIDKNLYEINSLEDISRELKYNYAYLSSLFKRVTGSTILSYYQRKKLEGARLFLLEENAKITEIADRLGYSSPYTFIRAFKTEYGISPKQYSKKRSLL